MPEPQHSIAQEQPREAEEGQDKDVKEGALEAVVDDLLLQVLADASVGLGEEDRRALSVEPSLELPPASQLGKGAASGEPGGAAATTRHHANRLSEQRGI